jgi:RHS repeat-associated protein
VLATYAYDDLGRRTSLTFGNGVVQAYNFDPISRLASLTNERSGTANDLSATFGYNPASQIASTTRTGDAYAWTGHFNENKTGTANGLNQLTQVGAKTLTHDARGNVTAFGTKSFTYSSENLLLTGPSSTTLAYDPAMRLQQIISGGVTTKLAYDGLDRIAEYDGSNALQRRYVHGQGVDEPLVWYEGTGTTDRRFMSSDERGSIISLTDSSGALLGINRYDEFGQPQSTNLGAFGYTGQAWLPSVSLWYYKARHYDPELGRFLQTDPIGTSGGINFYAYAGNDPVNFIDPLGLELSYAEFCRQNPDKCPVITGATDNGGLRSGEVIRVTPARLISEPSGVGESSSSLMPTICPPVETKVTGVGPNQANSPKNKSAISGIPGNQLPNGAVAIDPIDYGQSRVTNQNRSALSDIIIIPLWPLADQPSNGAPAIPRGLPSAGPYAVHDVIGPASARNQPGFHIDLYRYNTQKDALSSTRTVPTVSILPPNNAGLTCPSGQ